MGFLKGLGIGAAAALAGWGAAYAVEKIPKEPIKATWIKPVVGGTATALVVGLGFLAFGGK